jgi:3-deoxy-D-manno-octulosonic-acid transferase
MARRLYTLVYYCLLPLILLRLLWRAKKAPAYRQRIGERFGFFAAPEFAQAPVWVHAVSVGETIAAAPMIRRLIAENPQRPVVVTTMTPTGSERVQALFGQQVFHVYAPYDLPGSVKRFLLSIKPAVLVVMETELWPTIIYHCHRNGIPVIIANARLSAKSAQGYQRVASLTRSMLEQVSTVAAQTKADGERFCQLGLHHDQLQVTGSIKFDVELDKQMIEKAAQLYRDWHQGYTQVFIAASTHAGEDEQIIRAFITARERLPSLRLVLVPRHPERFESVYQQCLASGLPVARRSTDEAPGEDAAIILGDTMGEMMLFFGAADIAFIGGSLVNNGGHNMLEAAAWGVPVLSGPSLYNFAEISRLLEDVGAMKVVRDSAGLSAGLIHWSENEKARLAAGEAGRKVVEQNRGALRQLIAIVLRHASEAGSCSV